MALTTCLPQELLDEVIDFLHDDRPSLVAMSCAARRLRLRAQKHIFHTVTFSLPERTPSTFLPFLETSPHLLPLVRCVSFVVAELSDAITGRTRRYYLHDDEALSSVLNALPNVRDIELTGMVKLQPFLGLMQTISSSRVKALTLNLVFLESPHGLLDILAYFPSITSLRLLEVHTMLSALPGISDAASQLKELTITEGFTSSPMGVFFFHEIGNGWLKGLRTLNIESYFVNELPAIARLVEQLPHIVSLSLGDPFGDISHPSTQARLAREGSFIPFHRLERLNIRTPGIQSPWSHWWIRNLRESSGASVQKLRHLSISFSVAGMNHYVKPATPVSIFEMLKDLDDALLPAVLLTSVTLDLGTSGLTGADLARSYPFLSHRALLDTATVNLH